MRSTVLTTADLDEWKTYYDRLDVGPYHSPTYLSLLEGNFEFNDERAELFVLESDGEFVYYPYLVRELTTVPFADERDSALEGYFDIVASWYYGGPIATPDAEEELVQRFVSEFSDYCRESNYVAEFLRFDPNNRNHETFEHLNPQFNRETVYVDLTQSKEEIWDGYEGRNCRAIRQAQETELQTEWTDDPDDYDIFHEIYSNAMDAKDASDHYRFDPEFFNRLLDSELARLLVARHGEETVGGFIVVHDDKRAFHYLSASNPDYWDLRVNNLIFHRVITGMKEAGMKRFDFQGGPPGVFKFKKGFSPLRGEFYLATKIHMNEKYEQLVSAAENSGIEINEEYFPEYRVEKSG